MKKLIFIRHGKSKANLENRLGVYDAPLVSEGVEQAHIAGKKLGQCIPDIIVVSPQPRARHTAEIIAAEIGYGGDLIYDENCIERRYGSHDGERYAGGNTDILDLADDPDAETLEQLYERAQLFHKELQDLDKGFVIVVSHGGFGRALYRVINNLEPSSAVDFIENATPFEMI